MTPWQQWQPFRWFLSFECKARNFLLSFLPPHESNATFRGTCPIILPCCIPPYYNPLLRCQHRLYFAIAYLFVLAPVCGMHVSGEVCEFMG